MNSISKELKEKMKRKSAAEKKAAGTYRVSRDRNTPQLHISWDQTSELRQEEQNRLAYAQWSAVAPSLLAEGILKVTDILLASYCVLYAAGVKLRQMSMRTAKPSPAEHLSVRSL